MKKTIAFILCLPYAMAYSGSSPFKYNESGELPSGVEYSVEIKEVQYEKKSNELPDDGSMWGIDGGFCRYVVTIFNVKINNKPAYIYRKYYSDICDLTSVKVTEEKGQIILIVSGGDGAGAFTAKYTFKRNKLTQRMVRMSEMPDDYWELIVMHHNL